MNVQPIKQQIKDTMPLGFIYKPNNSREMISSEVLSKIDHDLDIYHQNLLKTKSNFDKYKLKFYDFIDIFSSPTFCVYSGRPGAGKSSKFADQLIRVALRNKAWYERLYKYPIDGYIPIKRKVFTNTPIEPHILHELGITDYYAEFHGIHQALQIRDADIFWDEMQVDCHIDMDDRLPRQAFEFFQQHRKLGLEIYATSQDFAQITKGVRRTAMRLVYYIKLIGSRNPSATRPPVKMPFLFSIGFDLDPATYDEETSKKGLEISFTSLPEFLILGPKQLLRYKTGYIIGQGEMPPYQHYERKCGKEGCKHCKIVHI